ncbi:MAG: sigma-70 family RNA polymerase sigma factor [Candidatus Marinimicrobia bacterium]|nr:sigma-70 family RNA polymerase sigma factor [Candidatus Neomarinimicrobiota bacterium]
MKTDHELIKIFQNGNESAFDDLVRRYLPQVYGFFSSFTGNKMVADDLAQEVFLKLYKNLAKFRFEAAFSTYLYRIQFNLANTYIRRNRWRNLLHLDQVPEQADFDNSQEIGWAKTELWAAVAGLPKKQRLVVMMRISQELPFRNIAGILEISEDSAKVNYQHALKTLKTNVERIK